MSKALYFLTFAAGVGAGIAGTWKYFNDRYERIAKEDSDSRRELASKFRDQPEKESAPNDISEEEPEQEVDRTEDIKEFANWIKEKNEQGTSKGKPKHRGPYVIAPEDYGAFEDYDAAELTFYKDGILADDEDDIVEDADTKVGDFYNHFGEFEDDSVYIRNDIFCIDYEILRDERTYEEATGDKPRLRWRKKNE